MEKTASLSFTQVFKAYLVLIKPRIILGNVITAAAGLFLAAKGQIYGGLFLATLVGLSSIIASACIFNNYIDREADRKMSRTQRRTAATKLILPQNALLSAALLAVLGTLLLAFFVNFLTTGIALLGLFVYVVLYSFSKYRTTHATLIGTIAGAVPPVVGYSAVSASLDEGAFLLFLILTLWQMPHFFAIAIYRLEDYAKASIPVLPVKKGIFVTKVQMLLYLIAFIAASCLLTVFGYTGSLYLIAAILLGLAWLKICLKGFKCADDQLWARQMFRFSLIVITGLCLVVPFSIQA